MNVKTRNKVIGYVVAAVLGFWLLGGFWGAIAAIALVFFVGFFFSARK